MICPFRVKMLSNEFFASFFRNFLESHYSRCLNISPDHPANGSKLELFEWSDITLRLFPSELKCYPAWQVGASFPSKSSFSICNSCDVYQNDPSRSCFQSWPHNRIFLPLPSHLLQTIYFFRLSAQRIRVEYLFVFFSEQCSICSCSR